MNNTFDSEMFKNLYSSAAQILLEKKEYKKKDKEEKEKKDSPTKVDTRPELKDSHDDDNDDDYNYDDEDEKKKDCKKDKKKKEASDEESNINEVGNTTLGSYIDKASDDIAHRSRETGKAMHRRDFSDNKESRRVNANIENKEQKKRTQRLKMIKLATKKLVNQTEEECEVNELTSKLLGKYINKSVKDLDYHGQKHGIKMQSASVESDPEEKKKTNKEASNIEKKMANRSHGIKSASRKLVNRSWGYEASDEESSIDEISTHKLRDYIKDAAADVGHLKRMSGDAMSHSNNKSLNKNTKDYYKKTSTNDALKAAQRSMMVRKAANKLVGRSMAKEDYIDEISDRTLGNYIHRATKDVGNNSEIQGLAQVAQHKTGGGTSNRSRKNWADIHDNMKNKVERRLKGISTAADKLSLKAEDIESGIMTNKDLKDRMRYHASAHADKQQELQYHHPDSPMHKKLSGEITTHRNLHNEYKHALFQRREQMDENILNESPHWDYVKLHGDKKTHGAIISATPDKHNFRVKFYQDNHEHPHKKEHYTKDLESAHMVAKKYVKESASSYTNWKHVKTHGNIDDVGAKVYKNGDEHKVKFYLNGEHRHGADYYTDNLHDAHSTAQHYIKRAIGENYNDMARNMLSFIDFTRE